MKVKPRVRGGSCALSGVLAVGLLVTIAAGRLSGQASQPSGIRVAPCVAIASLEGNDNFQRYCAVCHGTTGKGNGPAAGALRGPLPDLTTIAARHAGKFDRVAVERVISGADRRPSAHGTVAMPMWGPVFNGSEDAKVTTLRIQNLAEYLETLQRK
jgi:mono/diheme cytochrome c family protein